MTDSTMAKDPVPSDAEQAAEASEDSNSTTPKEAAVAPGKKRKPKPTTLKIVKVPGGLHRVVNQAGGSPPKEFKGMFTDLKRLQPAVEAHNEGK